jgi:hypothetical protein
MLCWIIFDDPQETFRRRVEGHFHRGGAPEDYTAAWDFLCVELGKLLVELEEGPQLGDDEGHLVAGIEDTDDEMDSVVEGVVLPLRQR